MSSCYLQEYAEFYRAILRVKYKQSKLTEFLGFLCHMYLRRERLDFSEFFLFSKNVKIYFYSKTNKMHQCIKFILFWNDTLCVSGVQDCTYSNRDLSNRCCCLLANKQIAVSVRHMPVAVCTVLNS